MTLIASLRSAFHRVPAPVPPPHPVEAAGFRCNVCAHENAGVPLAQMQDREFQSCRNCRSSLRMRSLVHLLSTELFGKSIPLPDFPVDKRIKGLGMSDWEGYAGKLSEKLDYLNTYYHQDPRLDISDIPESWAGRFRFLISSDVFEHIPGFALDAAFGNTRRLLDDRGFVIFTVPFLKQEQTLEHFPGLHDFRIIETGGKRYLYNRRADGSEEIFENLVFHGGDGMTLEMRMFGEGDLARRFAAAGFSSVRFRNEPVREFGIVWPIDFAIPVVARV